MTTERCPQCGHKPNPLWECSRIPCASRKPVTASPASKAPVKPSPHLAEEPVERE